MIIFFYIEIHKKSCFNEQKKLKKVNRNFLKFKKTQMFTRLIYLIRNLCTSKLCKQNNDLTRFLGDGRDTATDHTFCHAMNYCFTKSPQRG